MATNTCGDGQTRLTEARLILCWKATSMHCRSAMLADAGYVNNVEGLNNSAQGDPAASNVH
eukprot:scaffold12757_cov67-Cyclotella_meneghiniana.AAC.3